MTSDLTTRTLQMCRSCGGGASVDAHFCPQCEKILSLGRHGDFFAFMGVPRRLTLDAGVFEQRFRTLSRQFHPDFFYNATPAERRASLERSSYLNDAYRTLKQPVSRISYLLELEGCPASDRGSEGETGSPRAPMALLEEVFALNEELDAIREMRAAGAPEDQWRRRLDLARHPIEAKREEHERQLSDLSVRWDALTDSGAPDAERRTVLEALREQILERNYINNLLAGIDRELVPPSLGQHGAPGAATAPEPQAS